MVLGSSHISETTRVRFLAPTEFFNSIFSTCTLYRIKTKSNNSIIIIIICKISELLIKKRGLRRYKLLKSLKIWVFSSEGRSTHIEQSSDAGVERGDISLKICQNAKNLKKQIRSNI